MKKFLTWLLRPIIEAVIADTHVEIKTAKMAKSALFS